MGFGASMKKNLVITGSSRLIGFGRPSHFANLGWTIDGVDMWVDCFGLRGGARLDRWRRFARYLNYRHSDVDVRNKVRSRKLFKSVRSDALARRTARPSRGSAASRVPDDLDVNAATMERLRQAAREYCLNSSVCLSKTKVHGDITSEIVRVETTHAAGATARRGRRA